MLLGTWPPPLLKDRSSTTMVRAQAVERRRLYPFMAEWSWTVPSFPKLCYSHLEMMVVHLTVWARGLDERVDAVYLLITVPSPEQTLDTSYSCRFIQQNRWCLLLMAPFRPSPLQSRPLQAVDRVGMTHSGACTNGAMSGVHLIQNQK